MFRKWQLFSRHYINDVQVASNVAANTNYDMTALLTSDKVIEYIDIYTTNAGSAYMDSISIEMLNDYSLLSEGMTYTEPKLKLAFDNTGDICTIVNWKKAIVLGTYETR